MRLIREEKDFIRDAILLMLPMILQNFVTFSMSMADTFMVGVLGETALAAVTMANSPFYVMQLMIFGVQSGMSVLVAQYHGRGDQEAINRVMGIALFVSTTISGLLAVTAFCIPEQIMRVLTNNADLVAPGAAYTRYVGFSYFFAAISGVYIAAQRSTENPRLGAVLLTVSGVLNIFLNWVLIYGKLGAPMLGCAGAAIATLISRAFEVAVLCVYARFSRRLPLMPRALLHPGRVIAKDFAKYALPVVCNECLWSLAFSLYTVIMGHMADNAPILSAYTIAGNLQRMITPASFAAGGAAAVLIGREIGRGNRDQVQRKAWVLDALALVVGLVCMGIIALVRNVLAVHPAADAHGGHGVRHCHVHDADHDLRAAALEREPDEHRRRAARRRRRALCDAVRRRAAVRGVPAAGGAHGARLEAGHPLCVPVHVDRYVRAAVSGHAAPALRQVDPRRDAHRR